MARLPVWNAREAAYLTSIKNRSPQQRMLHWVLTREEARNGKHNGHQKPWVSDPIVQRYRFCNVRRMDDAVSQWLLHSWYKRKKRVVQNALLARFFNLPSTLEAIGYDSPWQPSTIHRKLVEIRESGRTLFNNAYMIRSVTCDDKAMHVLYDVLDPIIQDGWKPNTRSMRYTHESLLPYYGLGTFMAGQVVADLRWALPNGRWEDRRRWAPQGPGSSRGLRRWFEEDPHKSMPADEFYAKFAEYRDTLHRMLPAEISLRLEAMDYQNCLCEFDKYERVLWGEGTPKQRYEGVGP